MIPCDLIVSHANQLITCGGGAPRRGAEQGTLDVIADGAVASLDGRVVYAGPSCDLAAHVSPLPGAREIVARGKSVVPGFVKLYVRHVEFLRSWNPMKLVTRS